MEEDSPDRKALFENAGQKEHSILEKESRVFLELALAGAGQLKFS